MIIYIDMDGVLAKWKDASIEEIWEKGYYAALDPDESAVKMYQGLKDSGMDVRVLSAVLPNDYAEDEKYEWLLKNVDPDPFVVFVPYGENKADYAKVRNSILIDDFSRNLHEWTSAGGIGIKYMNGVNGTKGTWRGYRVDANADGSVLAKTIAGISIVEEEFYDHVL